MPAEMTAPDRSPPRPVANLRALLSFPACLKTMNRTCRTFWPWGPGASLCFCCSLANGFSNDRRARAPLPPPWSIEETPAFFIVKDGAGQLRPSLS